MTSIYREVILQIDASNAWLTLRDPVNVAKMFAGVLSSATIDGDVRTVTFAGGHVAQERIVAVDESRMRVAYTVRGERFTHHHASMQVVPLADGQCRFVWISDFLPDSERAFVEALVGAGCAAVARNLAR